MKQVELPPAIEWPTQHDSPYAQYTHRVYAYMFAALLVTGSVAYLASHSPIILNWMYVMQGADITGLKPFGWIILLLPLFMVMGISFRISRWGMEALHIALFGYAALVGLSFASLALLYDNSDITAAFLTSAGMFAAMSAFGAATGRDLSSVGSLLGTLLWGVIIAMLISLFFPSVHIQLGISIAAVIIFTGLIAYDTQKLRRLFHEASEDSRMRLALIGALTLYLDVLNLFLNLLTLFGRRRH